MSAKSTTQSSPKPTSDVEALFSAALARSRSRDRRSHPARTRPPARRDRADRLGEHRLARRAGSAGLGADQQICRRPAGQALLRRLPVRRYRRAAGDRAGDQAVRLQVRQCAAAFRRLRQRRGVLRADAAGRHLHGAQSRRRRPSHPRHGHQHVGQVVQAGALQRAPRRPAHRHGRGRASRPRAQAEADHRRRLGLSAHHRLPPLPRDLRRGRRLSVRRHGALRRPGRGRRAPVAVPACACRHHHHAQDAARAARRRHPHQRRGDWRRNSTRRCSPACRAAR